MPRSRDPLGYRWAVNYRDRRGKPHQTIVESPSHRAAIGAAIAAHPTGREFSAIKLSAQPLR